MTSSTFVLRHLVFCVIFIVQILQSESVSAILQQLLDCNANSNKLTQKRTNFLKNTNLPNAHPKIDVGTKPSRLVMCAGQWLTIAVTAQLAVASQKKVFCIQQSNKRIMSKWNSLSPDQKEQIKQVPFKFPIFTFICRLLKFVTQMVTVPLI